MKQMNQESILELMEALNNLTVALKKHQAAALTLREANDKATYQQDWEERFTWGILQECREDLEEILLENSK